MTVPVKGKVIYSKILDLDYKTNSFFFFCSFLFLMTLWCPKEKKTGRWNQWILYTTIFPNFTGLSINKVIAMEMEFIELFSEKRDDFDVT